MNWFTRPSAAHRVAIEWLRLVTRDDLRCNLLVRAVHAELIQLHARPEGLGRRYDSERLLFCLLRSPDVGLEIDQKVVDMFQRLDMLREQSETRRPDGYTIDDPHIVTVVNMFLRLDDRAKCEALRYMTERQS